MAVRKIEFILAPLALKKGAKHDKQEGEEFRALLAQFYVCDDCGAVLLSDEFVPICLACQK